MRDQRVQWTCRAAGRNLEDVRVDHRGADIAVTEKLQHRGNVSPGLQQKGGDGWQNCGAYSDVGIGTAPSPPTVRTNSRGSSTESAIPLPRSSSTSIFLTISNTRR